MKNKKIVLTGGGTAGHVSLNQAIIPTLEKENYDIHYIGSKDGIENEIIRDAFPHIQYHAISSGKLRRYASIKNFTDPIRVAKGLLQSLVILKKVKPSVIFSKGGYGSIPSALAGWILRVPIILHESDIVPGMANKIVARFAAETIVSFPNTQYFHILFHIQSLSTHVLANSFVQNIAFCISFL